MTDSNGRDYLFDNLKGILIFCVVYAHFLKATTFQTDTLGGAVYCIFFCFIMQSFLFVSGYFSKNTDTARAKAVKAFLFPYFILTLVMYGARVLIFGHDNASLHFIKPSMALWYLLTLFFYRYGLKAFVKIPHFLPVSFFLSLASGFMPFLDERLSLGRVFGFLPFFILGYCFKPSHIEKLRRLPGWTTAVMFLSLPLFGIAIAYTGIGWDSILFKRAYVEQGLAPMQGLLERSALILISLGWIALFLSCLPRHKTFLTSAGRGTMTVFALHIIVRYWIKATKVFGDQNLFCYAVLFLFAAASAWAFSRPAVVRLYQSAMTTAYRACLYLLRRIQRRARYLQRRIPMRI